MEEPPLRKPRRDPAGRAHAPLAQVSHEGLRRAALAQASAILRVLMEAALGRGEHVAVIRSLAEMCQYLLTFHF